jgi:hypothetical protein
MATAPTPPYKPTLPTAPVIPSATAGNASDSQPATPVQPAQNAPAKPSGADTLQKFETMGKAFQGQAEQPPATTKTAPPAATPAAQAGRTIQPSPPTTINAQEELTAKTVVPAKNQLPENKPSSSLYGFCFSLIVVVAVILIGLRLVKTRRRQETREANGEKAMQKPPAATTDVTTAAQDIAPKPKSTFEVRI